MKALVCLKPGKLEYKNIPAPVVTTGHAILKIRRIGICGTDLHAFRGTQPFFNYPRILGHEIAADFIEADSSTGFIPGEALTFIPYLSCKKCIACRSGKPNCCVDIKVSGVHIDGGMADYLSVPVESLIKSRGLGYEALALVEPFAIGAHGVRRAAIQKDEFVMVCGAGPIGLGTMQFARLAGAKLIALDIDERRLQFCKDNIGVPYTLNALSVNLKEQIRDLTNGDMPAVVIDATGNQDAINNGLQYLAHGGRYILIGLQRGDLIFNHPEFHKREATLMSSRNAMRADFDFVIETMVNNLITPSAFISRQVPFENVIEQFPDWLNPANGIIKVLVTKD